jgi:aminopeptidase N
MRNFTLAVLLLLGSIDGYSQWNQPGGCSKHVTFRQTEGVQGWTLPLGDGYDVHHYGFDLQVSNTSVQISGKVTCDAITTASMDSFWVELEPLVTIDSAWVNGVRITPVRTGTEVYFPLPSTLPVGTPIQSVIYYRGAQQGSGFFSAVTNRTNTTYNTPVTWTLSEPFGAIQWWPCKQDLYDKIDSIDFFATCALPARVGSNGLLQGVDTLPGNLARYRWKTREKTVFYLIHFGCANYLDYRNFAKPLALNGDSILIQHYVYDANNSAGQSNLSVVRTGLDRTPRMVEQFSNLFTLYPFWKEKYGHVQAELGGGMEHQTMSTMGGFGTDLTSHELAHQWFGDLVTCGTWSDIWLNEGWASYCEYLYRATFDSAGAFAWMSNAHNQVTNAPDGSVYVPVGGGEWRIFDGRLTYKKGGSVLHQLRFEIGDSAFFAGTRNYLNRYQNYSTITDSFRLEMERASGKNLQAFFQEWIYGEGFPTYQLKWNYQPGTGKVHFQLGQTASMPGITPSFSNDLPIKVDVAGQSFTFRLRGNTSAIQSFTIPQSVLRVTIDPENWIITGPNSVVNDPTLVPASTQGLISTPWMVLPNPSQGSFWLDNPANANMEIGVFDLQGKKLRQLRLLAGEKQLIDLPQGFYLAVDQFGKTQKIIVR